MQYEEPCCDNTLQLNINESVCYIQSEQYNLIIKQLLLIKFSHIWKSNGDI